MLTIGLMSGTSMDGIDAALLQTDGETEVIPLTDISYQYDPEYKILLKAAEYAVRQLSGNVPAAPAFYSEALHYYLKNEFSFTDIEIDNEKTKLAIYFHGNAKEPITFEQIIQRSTHLHAEIVKNLLKKAKLSSTDIDVIGYHGQTLLHRPLAKITIQIGKGNLLAELTNITVINDFRRRDVLAGGQGAPLAPLYHQALVVRDNKIPAAVVNCGGIANITFITGNKLSDIIGFDTGPGNGLIDRYVQQRTQGREQMDTNGQYGSKGKVNNRILDLLYQKAITLSDSNFFDIPPPKALDIGDLTLIPELNTLSLEDACATLEAFTADTIVRSIDFVKQDIPQHWILAGGGWHNPVIKKELVKRLKEKLGSDVIIQTADEMGWNNKALEAQIFAYLAVRSLKNLPISLPNTTFVPEPLCGGHAYLPPNGPSKTVAELLKKNKEVAID